MIMSGSIVFAFIHHLAFVLIFACLFYEHLALNDCIETDIMQKLVRIDLIYGISAAVILIVGILRVMYFEKGPDYYLHNWAFHIKITLFALIGLLSIYPTMMFLGWRKQLQKSLQPVADSARVRLAIMCIRAELLLFVLMLPPAALMARGYGTFG